MRPAYIFMSTIITLAQESESIILADKTVEMTLHTYQATCNAARAICEAENATLAVDESLERTYALLRFVDQQWPPSDFWIGLHYVSTVTGGESKWVWPDCFVQNLTQYSNWDFTQPQMPCVYYDVTEREWTTDNCWQELGFVCEKSIGPFTFNEWNGYPDISLFYIYQTLSAANVSECQSLCLTRIFNDRNCWAVNFEGTECTLYHSTLTDTNDNTDYEDVSNGADPGITCETFNNRIITNPSTSSLSTTVSSSTASTITTLATTSSSSTEASTTSAPTVTTLATTSSSSTAVSSTSAPTITTLATTSSSSTAVSSTSAPTITTLATTSSSSTAVSSTSAPTITTLATTSSSSTSSISTSMSSPSLATGTSTSTASQTSTLSTAAVASTLATTLNSSSQCYRICSCSSSASSNLTLEEKVEQIVTKLRVDKTKLSSSVRKKTSAKDERTSAKSVGYVALIVAIKELSTILIPDLLSIVRFIFIKLVNEQKQ